MVKAQKILYVKKFEGLPTLSNFSIEEEELPALQNDEILCEAIFLSVDPYMRLFLPDEHLNSVVVGGQIAKIIESKNSKYPVGSYVHAYFGWRTHTIAKAVEGLSNYERFLNANDVILLPDYHGLPLSLGLGYLGMPGATAYFGFLEICKPKSGETVVVTGAAGAVGSLVGQIAKIKGCKVIGFAGSDDKCDWLEKDLGFDYAFNYKTEDISSSLSKAAPDGIDCYFDNVGGEISSTIISKMNSRGRVAVCGFISSYNETEAPKATILQRYLVLKEIQIEGLFCYRWGDRFPEAWKDILKWIKSGLVKYRDTTTKGFDKMPQAFIDLFNGKNYGKAVIEI